MAFEGESDFFLLFYGMFFSELYEKSYLKVFEINCIRCVLWFDFF